MSFLKWGWNYIIIATFQIDIIVSQIILGSNIFQNSSPLSSTLISVCSSVKLKKPEVNGAIPNKPNRLRKFLFFICRLIYRIIFLKNINLVIQLTSLRVKSTTAFDKPTGIAPVCSPLSMTVSPLIITSDTPVAYFNGSLNVAWS